VFKCEKCGLFSQPGEKQVQMVVETRKKNYLDLKNGTTGEGFETVREIRVHSSCVPKKVGV